MLEVNTGTAVYFAISIVAFFILYVLVFIIDNPRGKNRISRFASVSFLLIFAGLILRDNGILGYGCISFGMVFALIDIIRKSKKR
jgi:hypothetical protein